MSEQSVTFETRYETYQQAVETYLAEQFTAEPAWKDLYEAMRYSLLSGGKRVRPVLTLEFARLSGLDWRLAVPVGCGLEMVHTFSLIHDDLPCMDDDDLRRGKPTSHKVFGETMAVLAGDALMPEAFRRILEAPGLSTDVRAECALILAKASGADGMGAGQVLDTLHTPATEAEVSLTHRLKTGAMLSAACQLGAAAGGGALLSAAREYGEQIGMAFQIQDDLLDVIGDEQEFGKPIGSDREEGKVTFVDLLGREGCVERVRECTDRAIAAVASADRDGFLRAFAEKLASRRK